MRLFAVPGGSMPLAGAVLMRCEEQCATAHRGSLAQPLEVIIQAKRGQ